MTSNLKKMPIKRHKGVTFVPVTLCFSERENGMTYELHIKGSKKLKWEERGFALSPQSSKHHFLGLVIGGCLGRGADPVHWLVEDFSVLGLPWPLRDPVSHQDSTSGHPRVEAAVALKPISSEIPQLPLWPSPKSWRKERYRWDLKEKFAKWGTAVLQDNRYIISVCGLSYWIWGTEMEVSF